jgi:hypothetical protein
LVTAALVLVVAAGFGNYVWAAIPLYVPVLATVVAVLGAAAGTIPFVRTMPVWDLIAWDNKRPLPKGDTEQRANYQVLARVVRAIATRRPDRARAALRQVEGPSGWALFLSQYLSGQADLLQKRRTDTGALKGMIDGLEEAYRPTAKIMLAALDGGAEWLEGRDWRVPFVVCRAELNIEPSIWRGLLPVRYFVILLMAFQLVPWAYWFWVH